MKAFRDTWKDGINSYLTYLHDRLGVARDLLAETGSVFLQIGDENVHRVRAVLDEVLGAENFIALISVIKTTLATNDFLSGVADYIVWYAKRKEACKYRHIYRTKVIGAEGAEHYNGVVSADGVRRRATAQERSGQALLPDKATFFTADQLQSASMGRDKGEGAAS